MPPHAETYLESMMVVPGFENCLMNPAFEMMPPLRLISIRRARNQHVLGLQLSGLSPAKAME